ncbi:hypothetical protein BSU04_31785 [Caballeronia sordidicola]|uniref:Uncharacterized protein n=1 Tax=Caballeronia sordidicola TaxID=196367 RepID=A0A226WTF9_CABSO|nr:hypothetical protein BSU04_31785 [Caballeronia sordidicola]
MELASPIHNLPPEFIEFYLEMWIPYLGDPSDRFAASNVGN